MKPRILRRVYLFLFSITAVSCTPHPRMVFSREDTVRRRLPIPGNLTYVRTLLQQDPNTVTVVGRTYLSSFHFRSPQTPVGKRVQWADCRDTDCQKDILVAHKRGDDSAMLCGVSRGLGTVCCEVNLLEENLVCRPTEYLKKIRDTIQAFIMNERELSALAETATGTDLYITNSGQGHTVGIHKYGYKRVTSMQYIQGSSTIKEQYYVGLMLDRDPQNPLQDKAYAFFREKSKSDGLYSEMWLPYVTRVCMADVGGPKNNLQAGWTSQLNARLYCGDPDSKRYFSELVDAATVEATPREDARVYGLFRNKWGFTAVCVYSLQDIEQVFRSSPFRGDVGGKFNRSRDCVADSTHIDMNTLEKIKGLSEMDQWVLPVQRSAPLLVSHRNYTHILVDTLKGQGGRALLFLSLYHGGVHKVLHDGNHSFIIAEYQPFSSRGHISSMFLHPSSRNLYVSTGSELIQMDVTNCSLYGSTCSECVLARDPDCGWDGTHCSLQTRGALQDVSAGDHSICGTPPNGGSSTPVDTVALLYNSNYFLQCSISSLHAQYTWSHDGNHIPCTMRHGQCLYLIEGMGLEQEGTYQCMLEEKGFSRVQAQYRLLLDGGSAGCASRPLLWLCLMVALVMSVCCLS